MKFVKISDGSPFEGEMPKEVRNPVTERVSESMSITKMDIVKEGDPRWEDALFAWMFARGYAKVVE